MLLSLDDLLVTLVKLKVVSPDCSAKFLRVTKFTLVHQSNELKLIPSTSLHL